MLTVKRLPFEIYERPSHLPTALLTGGIGDIISCFSFLDQYPKKVLYAGPSDRSGPIGTLIRQLGIDFEIIGRDRVYYHKSEVEAVVGGLDGVEDMSIKTFFPQCLSGERQYVGCPWVKMNWPRPIEEEYIVCTPASANYGLGRNFSDAEMGMAVQQKKKVAVIFKGQYPLPSHPNILPTMNRTSILEAFQWLAHASGFVGIDSWTSVVACAVGPSCPCLIRSCSDFYYRYRTVYSAPGGSHIRVVAELR